MSTPLRGYSYVDLDVDTDVQDLLDRFNLVISDIEIATALLSLQTVHKWIMLR